MKMKKKKNYENNAIFDMYLDRTICVDAFDTLDSWIF